MSVLYVYALADGLGDISDLRGVQREMLNVMAIDRCAAIAGEVDARPAIDAASLKAQDTLIRALHERAAALLPMRFGTTASSEEDLQRLIRAREGIMNRLDAVRGCEQMIVRVFAERTRDVATSVTTPSSGRSYLEARAASRVASPELAAIARAPDALQRDVRIEPAQQSGLYGSVYHLIERGRAAEYRDAIERTAAKLPATRVVITGPLPAYAFA